ncbi:MAG: diguanylate cyclase [Campylobacterales bacterium]|nr:diguanylate cyclase [Campylobacterales bacterium]
MSRFVERRKANLTPAKRLRKSLNILLITISLGLLFIGSIGFVNVTSMRSNLDDIYKNSLIPVANITKMASLYYNELQEPLFSVFLNLKQKGEAIEQMKNGLSAIRNIWIQYAANIRSFSKEEIERMGLEIEMTNKYYERAIKHLSSTLKANEISVKAVADNTKHVRSIIENIVSAEVDFASKNRENQLDTYNMLLLQLACIFLVAFFIVIYIVSAIFKGIKIQQEELEIATKKLQEANTKLEDASFTDALTDLKNRRYFNIVFDKEYKTSLRNQTGFVFMMLDIDFFKQYNDTYGHLKGDDTLKAVALSLKETLKRPGDYCFRLGGEEFGVILCDSTPQQAEIVAKRINHNIESLKIPHIKSTASSNVTISIGVTQIIPTENSDMEDVISKADDYLYKTKENGRNGYTIGDVSGKILLQSQRG